MLITTRAAIKDFIGITTSENDIILSSIATAVSAHIERYLRRQIEIKERVKYFDVDKNQKVFSFDAYPVSACVIYNDTLRKVKDESKSGLYKELDELITSWFENCHSDRLMVAPVDLKDEWFHNNSQIGRQYIKSILKREFKLEPEDSIIRYEPFDKMTKTGRPYTFLRENFIKTTKNFGETENFVTTEKDTNYGNLPF